MEVTPKTLADVKGGTLISYEGKVQVDFLSCLDVAIWLQDYWKVTNQIWCQYLLKIFCAFCNISHYCVCHLKIVGVSRLLLNKIYGDLSSLQLTILQLFYYLMLLENSTVLLTSEFDFSVVLLSFWRLLKFLMSM